MNWIRNYLIERQQYVEIGAKNSDVMKVTRGIPQGSILGPLFYTIYTNELPTTIENKDCHEPVHREKQALFPNNCRKCGSVPSFADDATFIVQTKTRNESQVKIDNATIIIKNFLNSQELVVNLSKTTLLESIVKQKRARQKCIQPSLTTQKESGEEKIIYPEQNIRLL